MPAVGCGGAGEPSGPTLRLGPQLRLLVVVSSGGAGASAGRTLNDWRAGYIVQLLKVANVLAGDGAVVWHAVGEGLLRWLGAGLRPARDGGGAGTARDGGGNGTGRDRGDWPE